MTGDASSSRIAGRVPAQYSIENRIADEHDGAAQIGLQHDEAERQRG